MINILVYYDKNENIILKGIKNDIKFKEAKKHNEFNFNKEDLNIQVQKIEEINKIFDNDLEPTNNIFSPENDWEELEDEYNIGLDLGARYCRIGVYRNCGVEMIPNKNGEVNTPSIVTILDEKTILKGEDAFDYLENNYEQSIYNIKRFIGRKYNDKELQEEIKSENYPFQIRGDKNGNLLISINKDNKVLQYAAE